VAWIGSLEGYAYISERPKGSGGDGDTDPGDGSSYGYWQ